jgi:hypothetical protein
VSAIHTVAASSRAIGRTSRSSRTSKSSKILRGSISSREDFLVKTSRKREKGRESKMEKNRDSGENSLGSFAWYDPGSCSWRTSQQSLFPDEDSISSSVILPRSGSMQNGHVFERPPLEPPISERDFSLSDGIHLARFPTPSASEYGSGGNGSGNNTKSRGRPSLWTMARRGDFPSCEDSTGRILPDPLIVELLMGLPSLWTDSER